jgi:hypothetical protein
MDFVYPYLANSSLGNEIQYSIASVHEYYVGTPRITIIGDCPPGFDGQHIPVSRVRDNGDPFRPYRDVWNKLSFAAASQLIGSDFYWMMDDIYFVGPVTDAELQVPRHNGAHDPSRIKTYPSGKTTWLELKRKTLAAVADAGFGVVYDYATHLPQFVRKTELRELQKKIDISRNMHLWEIIYGNMFRSAPIWYDNNFFYRFTKPQSLSQLLQQFAAVTIVNTGHWVWNEATKQALETWINVNQNSEKDDMAPPKLAVEKATRWPCEHRGEFVELVDNKLCSLRAKKSEPVYYCEKFERNVTIDPYESAQPQLCCKRCDLFDWGGKRRPIKQPRSSVVKISSLAIPADVRESGLRMISPETVNKGKIVVTSLVPKRDESQAKALATWHSHQLRIFTIQGADDDVDQLKDIYPEVETFVKLPEKGKPRISQLISSMAEITDETYMLINSDIELAKMFLFPIDIEKDEFRIGVRRNYRRQKPDAKIERWGIDVFFVTPELAKTMLDAPFQIGEPWWDYWIVYHAEHAGLTVKLQRNPFFYHKIHRQRWSRRNHQVNKTTFCEMYSLDDFDPSAWRNQLRKRING